MFRCRGPNRSRGRAAPFFSITCLIMYLVYHSLSVNTANSFEKKCFLYITALTRFFKLRIKFGQSLAEGPHLGVSHV